MNRKSWIAVLTLFACLATVFLAPSAYALPPQQSYTPGDVVALRGTPHLWIAGDDGALHWAGDTRALANRPVNWSSRRELSLDELRAQRRGDPYLSAGLLKEGDPIYLVKWESDQSAPTLLQIQSIPDVELFGINGSNYGAFVLDRNAWQGRFGLNFDALTRGTLAPAVAPPATPTPAVTATPAVTLQAREVERRQAAQYEYEYRFEISGAAPNARLFATVEFEEWICSPECTDTFRSRRGPFEIGTANREGRLEWKETHPPYKGSTYIFTDTQGNRVTVGIGNDI